MNSSDQILKFLERLEIKIDKIEAKTDRLDSRLDSSDKTLVKQEANLGEHMRRTDRLEKLYEEVREENKTAVTKLSEDLKPVKKHVAYMEGALKGLGVLAGVITLIGGIIKIAEYFIS